MRYLTYIFLLLLFSCNYSTEDSKSLNDEYIATEEKSLNSVWDTLLNLKNNRIKIDSSLYFKIFNKHFSELDSVYVYDIRKSIYNYTPLILTYNTIECDSEYSYKVLYLIDSNLNVINDFAFEYDIDHDLLNSKSRFINDSIIEVTEEEGLSYFSDSFVTRTIILEINRLGQFDTIKMDSVYSYIIY